MSTIDGVEESFASLTHDELTLVLEQNYADILLGRDLEGARRVCDNVLREALVRNDQDVIANVFYNIGSYYSHKGNLTEAIEYFAKSEAHTTRSTNLAKCTGNRANCLSKLGRLPEAMSLRRQGMKRLGYPDRERMSAKERMELSTFLLNNAADCWDLGDFSKAAELLHEFQQHKSDAHPNTAAVAPYFLATCLMRQEDWLGAYEQLQPLLGTAPQMREEVLAQYAYTCMRLGKVKELEQLVRDFQRSDNVFSDWAYHTTIACLAFARSDFTVALSESLLAVDACSDLDDRSALPGSYREAARAYAALGDLENATLWLEHALQIAQEMKIRSSEIVYLRELADHYARRADYEKAYNALQRYHKTAEELWSIRTANTLESLKWEHELEISNTERAAEKSRNEALQQRLSNHASQLVTQIELLAGIREDVLSIVRDAPRTDPYMVKIRQRFKELPCSSIDWPQFEQQFNEVHPNFRQHLTAEYPTLTSTEVRICMMLRMDRKTSDIARLFCISERAVEFHRLNIRRKVGLAKEDNLTKALAKF